MKTQPYTPTPVDTSVKITDELFLTSEHWGPNERLLAPAAILVMAQLMLTQTPFEATAADGSYRLTYKDELLHGPIIFGAAIEAVTKVLGAVAKTLRDDIVSIVVEEFKRQQEIAPTT